MSGPRPRTLAVIAFSFVVTLMLAGKAGAQESRETGAPAEAAPSFENLDALSWLVGTWGDEQTLEHWTNGKGGLMLGVHRDLRDGRASFFEFLRIALTRDGGIVYLASPVGRHPPTAFPLTEVAEHRAVFTNPDHDDPQRIEYALEDGDLVVTISKADRSNPRSWRWRPLQGQL